MGSKYSIQENDWGGWLEVPTSAPGWAASPALITGVFPLKTGQGRLSLDFIQPLSPGGGRRRRVDLKVIQHGPEHLVGSVRDNDGTLRTTVVSAISFDWLASYCPDFFGRRPPHAASMMVDGVPAWESTPRMYLDRVLGRSVNNLLHGASAGSFGVELQPMPARSTTFMMDVTYPPLDSLLIARGFVPQEMEEKWFIFLADGRLRFQRSWTGVLVYDVDAAWRDDRLYLGSVQANRDPEQYGETDDGHDAAMLKWIIDVVLRGVRSPFPVKEDDVPLTSWAIAGSASL